MYFSSSKTRMHPSWSSRIDLESFSNRRSRRDEDFGHIFIEIGAMQPMKVPLQSFRFFRTFYRSPNLEIRHPNGGYHHVERSK